jgi:hypothetical protein
MNGLIHRYFLIIGVYGKPEGGGVVFVNKLCNNFTKRSALRRERPRDSGKRTLKVKDCHQGGWGSDNFGGMIPITYLWSVSGALAFDKVRLKRHSGSFRKWWEDEEPKIFSDF